MIAPQELAGRAALVTGGASGIGRGIARVLAREGTKVLVADIDLPGAAAVARDITAAGGEAIALHADVSCDQTFEGLKAAMLDRFGRADIVVNNAGVIMRGLPEHVPLAEWRRILDINLLSVVRSNLAFLPHLIAQGSGHIVNVGSFAGLYTYAYDRQPYAASKAAIVQLSEGLALYLEPKGIGVTCLCPGPVITNISTGVRSFGPETVTRPPDGLACRTAEEVGEIVRDAIRVRRFMVPTDDAIWDKLIERARDWDGFLESQRQLMI